jgi:hypothetical protein
MLAPRRDVRSTPDGGSAVLPPGRSYTAHWEVLGCALCLLTASAIPLTGPVWGWGFCPGSRRPRARVPLASRLWFPGPRPLPVFRSAFCDCLSLNVSGLSSSWVASRIVGGKSSFIVLPLDMTAVMANGPRHLGVNLLGDVAINLGCLEKHRARECVSGTTARGAAGL